MALYQAFAASLLEDSSLVSNYALARAVLFVVPRSKYGFTKAGEKRLPIETTLLPSRAERMTKVLIIVRETLRTDTSVMVYCTLDCAAGFSTQRSTCLSSSLA